MTQADIRRALVNCPTTLRGKVKVYKLLVPNTGNTDGKKWPDSRILIAKSRLFRVADSIDKIEGGLVYHKPILQNVTYGEW